MIEVGKVLTLSNKKKYIVVARIEHNEQIYYSLTNIDDNKDIEICYLTIEDEKIRVNIVDKENHEEIGEIIEKLIVEATRILMEAIGKEETA